MSISAPSRLNVTVPLAWPNAAGAAADRGPGRLAAAALPHQREALAGVQVEVDAADGLHRGTGAGPVLDLEVADGQQWLALAATHRAGS